MCLLAALKNDRHYEGSRLWHPTLWHGKSAENSFVRSFDGLFFFNATEHWFNSLESHFGSSMLRALNMHIGYI